MTLLERLMNGEIPYRDIPIDADLIEQMKSNAAIAQAVKERMQNSDHRVRLAAETILDRADELLEGK